MATKDSRIAVRLSTEQSELIRQAAEVEGATVTDFTVASAVAHARDVLADRRVFALDDADWAEFEATLDRPVQHNAALEKLFLRGSVFDDA